MGKELATWTAVNLAILCIVSIVLIINFAFKDEIILRLSLREILVIILYVIQLKVNFFIIANRVKY